jgi:periplasmic protein TonB
MLQPLVSFTWETPRMSINLIESEHRSQKSLGGTFVSIALHASLISLAVYASASAGEVRVKVPSDTMRIVYPVPPKDPEPAPSPPLHPHPTNPTTPATPRAPVIRAPIDIPDKLPPIDNSSSAAPAESLFSIGRSGADAHGITSTTGPDSGEPLFASQVDKAAVPRAGNTIPKYPSLLESSHVGGSVLVQFVVDTLGNADMSTFAVLQSSNELFAQSLQATLPKWRFYPAEAGGRKVKQVVQLPLKFVAPRR